MYTLIHYCYCNLVYKIGSIYWPVSSSVTNLDGAGVLRIMCHGREGSLTVARPTRIHGDTSACMATRPRMKSQENDLLISMVRCRNRWRRMLRVNGGDVEEVKVRWKVCTGEYTAQWVENSDGTGQVMARSALHQMRGRCGWEGCRRAGDLVEEEGRECEKDSKRELPQG